MKFATLLILIAAFIWTFPSCGPTGPEDVSTPSQQDDAGSVALYEDLQQRDDVLINLELAYNDKNVAQAARLFDDIFVFFFSPADVANGDVGASQWGQGDEITATANLFGFDTATGILMVSPNGAVVEEVTWGRLKWLFYGNPPDSVSINLSLTYMPGEGTWISIPQGNETWYQKTASYQLVVIADDVTYLNGGPINATFTVRQVNQAGNTIWQLVEWRDDVP